MQRSNPLSGLLKLAAGFAFPGAGFLLNKGGKLKEGLMSLNDSIQNSDFGRSTSLMDYLDMKKFGGYNEREMARRINMDEAKLLQADIDSGMYDGMGVKPVQTFDSSIMESPLLPGAESATGLTIAELQALIDNATNNLGST